MTTDPVSLDEVWRQMITDVGGTQPDDSTLRALMLAFGTAVGSGTFVQGPVEVLGPFTIDYTNPDIATGATFGYTPSIGDTIVGFIAPDWTAWDQDPYLSPSLAAIETDYQDLNLLANGAYQYEAGNPTATGTAPGWKKITTLMPGFGGTGSIQFLAADPPVIVTYSTPTTGAMTFWLVVIPGKLLPAP